MIDLLVDSGATKAEWRTIPPLNTESIFTQGIHPYFQSKEDMENIIDKELIPELSQQRIAKIYYYGAGCAAKDKSNLVKNVLQKKFPSTQIQVWTDMLGGARALCQRNKGIACTLGTGANVVVYDGENIIEHLSGLGYVLGDEGSGAYFGKKIIQMYLYDELEKSVKNEFEKLFRTSKDEILNNIYRKPNASRYLSGFCKLLINQRGNKQVESLIHNGLLEVFQRHIFKIEKYNTLPIHFTGSISYYFKDVLALICKENNLNLGNVIKNPMDGLIKFHN